MLSYQISHLERHYQVIRGGEGKFTSYNAVFSADLSRAELVKLINEVLSIRPDLPAHKKLLFSHFWLLRDKLFSAVSTSAGFSGTIMLVCCLSPGL